MITGAEKWHYLTVKSLHKILRGVTPKIMEMRQYSWAIMPKGKSHKGVSRKRSTPNAPKNKHFLPSDTHTYVCVCAYQVVRNVRFLENLACFVFLKHPFWDFPFCLIKGLIILIACIHSEQQINSNHMTTFATIMISVMWRHTPISWGLIMDKNLWKYHLIFMII